MSEDLNVGAEEVIVETLTEETPVVEEVVAEETPVTEEVVVEAPVEEVVG